MGEVGRQLRGTPGKHPLVEDGGPRSGHPGEGRYRVLFRSRRPTGERSLGFPAPSILLCLRFHRSLLGEFSTAPKSAKKRRSQTMTINEQTPRPRSRKSTAAPWVLLAGFTSLAGLFHASAQCPNISGVYSITGQSITSTTRAGVTEWETNSMDGQAIVTQTGCNVTLSDADAATGGRSSYLGYVAGNSVVLTGASFSGLPAEISITNATVSGTLLISGSTLIYNNLSIQFSGVLFGQSFSAHGTATGVFTYAGPLTDPWPDASELGDGWKRSGWFGDFYRGYYPWIYHAQHGWLYVFGTDPTSTWLYNPAMGFLWTGSGTYPWLWSDQERTWLYYVKGSHSPRWFFNWNTQAWERD